VAVVKTLTGWFTEDAQQRAVPADLKYQRGFLAELDRRVVGFITLFVAEGRLNIGWLAVHRDYHRRGIGGKLVARAEKLAVEMGLTEIATYTLGDSVDFEPYEQTRAFYFKLGFRVYQRNKTDNPECPEEIRIKKTVAQPSAAADG
jgi:GNAT superfamily N-acetyltransferase